MTIAEDTRGARAGTDVITASAGAPPAARGITGVEGTGSYGAGLARHLAAAGISVAGAGRADRQDRHRQGKSDPLDAVSAARAAQSGRASGAPRGRDGAVEAIRALTQAAGAGPGGQPGPGPDHHRPR